MESNCQSSPGEIPDAERAVEAGRLISLGVAVKYIAYRHGIPG